MKYNKIISAALSAALLTACSGGGAESSDAPVLIGSTTAPVQQTVAEEVLDLIEGFRGNTDKESFTLYWEAFIGADGYELTMREQGGDTENKHFISASEKSYTVSGYHPGDSAEFVLRAYKQEGARKEYIAQSPALTLTAMRDSCTLDIKSVCQYSKPALPTGCECTALTTVLKYYGFTVTKNEIADTYLEKTAFTEKKTGGKNGETVLIGADPDVSFPGDPNDENSYGCYSKPIADAANKYLTAQGTNLRAKVQDGEELSYWYNYVNNGRPVIIWATDSMKKTVVADTWQTKDGKTIEWLHNEHCLVLVGYDTVKKTVAVCDPISRSVIPTVYKASLFEKRYNEQGRRAVLIE